MLTAHQVSLFFVVALVAVTAYFLLGGIPLLVLKHDQTMDGKFVTSFYTTYFKMSVALALPATLSHAWAGRFALCMVTAFVLGLTWLIGYKWLAQMRALCAEIRDKNTAAIATFRNRHKTLIGVNAAQLLVLLGSFVLL